MSVEPSIHTLLGPIQLALVAERARGWLIYDLRGRSLVAARLLGLRACGTERRFFYWIPAEGLPVAIVHDDDATGLPDLPGERARYRTAIELRATLEAHVPREGTVLVEQAPFAQIADLAIVDEATLSLLRGRDTLVRSSLELVNRFAGPLAESEREEVAHVIADLAALRAALGRTLVSSTFATWQELWTRIESEAAARMLVLADESGFAIDQLARAQRASERDGGAIVPGSSARLDLWAMRRGSISRVLVPSSIDLFVGSESAAHASLATVVAASEDEITRAVDERAKRGRVLGSEIAEIAWSAVRRRGLALASTCVGWPLGPVARGSHACTFDAEGFADPREVVFGTAWALRLGIDDGRAIAWRTSVIERGEGGVGVLARGTDGLVVRAS
ncbi:MAG: hypothetical protein J0L92_16220 [Deltaproteobacteria bacterium]|nr:hypothetical protein [Deltaproteobacteria bacterium]